MPQGAIFGFLGPNGAGKTTTIRMLLGLVRPSSGSARVCGFDVRDSRRAGAVGAIVETPAFYPYLGGRENLRVLALSAGMAAPASELDRLLALVGLARDGARLVSGYSLGMKQRLGIASALLGDPEVLFLDEPTNGLDPDGAREIRELLASLRRDGRTVFLSSHLLAEVERVCTDVAILHRGELKLQGSVERLLGARGIELRVSPVEKACALTGAAARDGWISLDCAEPEVPALLRRLLASGVDVFEVRPQRSSLEQVFFEATSGEGD